MTTSSNAGAPEGLCAVEGCQNAGRPQVCPYDGRYHHHGRIHYQNGHRWHPDLIFRPLDAGGWRMICTYHYGTIEAARKAAQS